MTVIVRFKNVVVPPALALYCMVKMLDPALRSVKTVVVLAWIDPPEAERAFETAFASLAVCVGVTPLTAKLAHPLEFWVMGFTEAVTITIALVPVVNVTDTSMPVVPHTA